jgi:hypothetical protein
MTEQKRQERIQEATRLSDEALRTHMATNYRRRWAAQRVVDEAEDEEEVRWSEYKRRLVTGMAPENLEVYHRYRADDESEDAEAWWLEHFLTPRLKSLGIHALRYQGRELTASQKEQRETYESKVER